MFSYPCTTDSNEGGFSPGWGSTSVAFSSTSSWPGFLFSLKHFSHLSHSCIKTCHNSVFSLYFQTFWPKWLNFFLSFKNVSVYDRKMTEKNKGPGAEVTIQTAVQSSWQIPVWCNNCSQFLHGKQFTACQKIRILAVPVVFDCLVT